MQVEANKFGRLHLFASMTSHTAFLKYPNHEILRDLVSLPKEYQKEFASLAQLIKGYVTSHETYREFTRRILLIIASIMRSMREIREMVNSYRAVSAVINKNINLLESLFKEYISFETIQYQLMSSNFNANALRLKMKKYVEAEASREPPTTGSLDLQNIPMNICLKDFINRRKNHHLKCEKLHRWAEERVSGLN